MFKCVGKSIEVSYDTGYHYKIDYLSETKLRWTSLKERPDGGPMSGEETYFLNQQSDDIFTLNWIEDTGISVSQNLDFGKMQAYAFVAWNDPSARGGRAILEQRGTIKLRE